MDPVGASHNFVRGSSSFIIHCELLDLYFFSSENWSGFIYSMRLIYVIQ